MADGAGGGEPFQRFVAGYPGPSLQVSRTGRIAIELEEEVVRFRAAACGDPPDLHRELASLGHGGFEGLAGIVEEEEVDEIGDAQPFEPQPRLLRRTFRGELALRGQRLQGIDRGLVEFADGQKELAVMHGRRFRLRIERNRGALVAGFDRSTQLCRLVCRAIGKSRQRKAGE